MEKIIVRGGNRLEGTVKVEGAKTQFCRFWLLHFWQAKGNLY